MKEYDRKRNQIRNKTYRLCPICNNEVCKTDLSKHQQSNKCELFKTRNDNYVIVDGRTYLKGNSPFEGICYDNHIRYDIHEVKQ